MSDKTKIICTIGPSSWSVEILHRLADAGMNVARLNFSHGSHEQHARTIEKIKQIRKETGHNIGILQDLSGPKIRTGNLPEEGVVLEDDSLVRLVPGREFDTAASPLCIPVEYPNLLADIKENTRILLDDGLLELTAAKTASDHLECRVVHGGTLLSHKGVNFPGCVISQRAPTAKDLQDLAFGLDQGVDFVALSFVQTSDDIANLRGEIEKRKANVSVIAKLETATSVQNLDGIIDMCDGVMVARGDLGIETELTMLPINQKLIISKANSKGIIVIVATQMLDSMIRNPLPTRAEVTDVANAIHDGADAIMLSGETASGKYPLEAVTIMRQVARNVETNISLTGRWMHDQRQRTYPSGEMAIAHSVCTSAEKLNAVLIAAHTLSGQTARLISQVRPTTRIVAITPVESTHHQLSLAWGVESIYAHGMETDFLKSIARADDILIDAGFVKKDDLVIVSTGIPASIAGGTNLMKIHRIGEV